MPGVVDGGAIFLDLASIEDIARLVIVTFARPSDSPSDGLDVPAFLGMVEAGESHHN
jgi:hypothetical protein